eukprot:365122-Chlamydomonas_euryale.AAC.55
MNLCKTGWMDGVGGRAWAGQSACPLSTSPPLHACVTSVLGTHASHASPDVPHAAALLSSQSMLDILQRPFACWDGLERTDGFDWGLVEASYRSGSGLVEASIRYDGELVEASVRSDWGLVEVSIRYGRGHVEASIRPHAYNCGHFSTHTCIVVFAWSGIENTSVPGTTQSRYITNQQHQTLKWRLETSTGTYSRTGPSRMNAPTLNLQLDPQSSASSKRPSSSLVSYTCAGCSRNAEPVCGGAAYIWAGAAECMENATWLHAWEMLTPMRLHAWVMLTCMQLHEWVMLTRPCGCMNG